MQRNFGNTFGRTAEGKERDYQDFIRRLNSPPVNPEVPLSQPPQPETVSGVILPPNGTLSFIDKKQLYDQVQKYFEAEFPNHKEIFEKLTWDTNNNVTNGSNTYIAIATDMFCKKHMPGYRLARQLDLETDLQKFKGAYVDSGLALRSTDGTNAKQAKSLYKQLHKKNKKIKLPVWVDLRGLSLDSSLNINLTDESTYKTADCLNWANETHYSAKDDFGLPSSEDKTSDRQIWTPNTKKGLLGCYLNWNSDLVSDSEDFAYSNSNGRVVVSKARSA